jgi:opacity protein-like surface antigen
MLRRFACLGLTVLLGLVLASDAEAQRRGFIIGGGLGAGLSAGDVNTEVGVATDFKIGAMIGESIQLYYANKMVFTPTEVADFAGTGVGGLGITYQMPNGFRINGLVGLSSYILYFDGDATAEWGFGIGAGVGYEFTKYWLINLDGSWGQPLDGVNIFNVALTFNVLSF